MEINPFIHHRKGIFFTSVASGSNLSPSSKVMSFAEHQALDQRGSADPIMTHMLHGAGIFTNIYPINDPNVGKYTIHGASG